MKKLGQFKSAKWVDVGVYSATYGKSGPLAISLICDDGEPLATLSVNMYTPECSADSSALPKDCFYVKTWSENETLAAEALASGIFKQRDDLPTARSGFVSAPAWQIALAA